MNKKYDFLIVGSGLFGSTFAYEARKKGKKCLVIDKRKHIGGNIYTQEKSGINIHKYGAHIFHTSNKQVWDYINKFSEFNNFINSPIANYKEDLYNLPFNMNTFYQMWGVHTPKQAKEKIMEEIKHLNIKSPRNLEEKAVSLVGSDIYYKLIKGYTEKQWGCRCSELPSFIIERIPLRFTFDNNYFNDTYQGIPNNGYTKIIEKMLVETEVLLNTDYKKFMAENGEVSKYTIYTGPIDEYFDYCLGELEYRSLEFKLKELDIEDFQGNAVVNYTDRDIPYTRIIEHKHFEFGTQKNTVISYEYPVKWNKEMEPYYPINDEKNNSLYKEYLKLSKEKVPNVFFGGRLGMYKYFDMDKTIEAALSLAKELL
ncbi:MAG: UDP-galactopyranose mutase [Clostridium butyricum]|uniref:UDP-galactopyranose mutase n=1 Tax=Clostridium sp. TaxID=1506 RepID=UPI0028FF14A4|nr:UDP-galactopyranose mutase [Clostridium sp.]MDU1339598.1 UDP-galactopyranose mutase [Clostridium butyricum]MDU4589342.1 UDP-galactopyranose mutase [Clostridium sp.]